MGDSRLSKTFGCLMGRKDTKRSEPSQSDSVERPCKRRKLSPPPPPKETSNKGSIVERLPPELYLSLVQQMSPVEAVLLSLTCKALWAQVKLQFRDVIHKLQCCQPLDQTMHFLRMLEKDSPRYIVCTAGLQLHRRKRHESEFVYVRYLSSHPRPCSSELGEVTIDVGKSDQLRIHREAVDLVLRASRLGPEYGLSLDTVKKEMKWTVFSVTHFDVDFHSMGIIVPSGDGENDHLLLKSEYSFKVDLRRSLQDQIRDAGVGACHHQPMEQNRCLVEAIDRSRSPQECTPLFGSRCRYCPSEILVEVVTTPGEVFASVNLCVIRDVGPRGDHRSPIWQAQMSDWGRSSMGTAIDFDRTRYRFGNKKLCELWDEVEKLSEFKKKESGK